MWLGTEILVASVSARNSINTHLTTKVIMSLTKSQTFQIRFFISKVKIILSELRKTKRGTKEFKYIYCCNFITKMFCESHEMTICLLKSLTRGRQSINVTLLVSELLWGLSWIIYENFWDLALLVIAVYVFIHSSNMDMLSIYCVLDIVSVLY